MARPWSARCYGVARQREGSRQNSIGGPALTSFISLTRAGALMARPWSARCYGVARQREGSRQNSIGGPALTSFISLTRAGALMARPWSARCYGVARQREGSRQNSIGGPALTSFISLTRAGALMARPWPARCYGVARQREGSRQNSIGGPALTSFITLSAREGADGQAVACPLLRGSSATRGVAPKQHRGLRRAFSPAFFGLVLFIPWRVGAEESGAAKYGFGRRDAARLARAGWI